MADVENPARIAAGIAGHRRGDLGERQRVGIDRPLEQAVVEEARRAIGLGASSRSGGRCRSRGRAPGPASGHRGRLHRPTERWTWRPLAAQIGSGHGRNAMAEERMEGGCACGRVRFTAKVPNDEAYLCHCRMCQRATGSVSIAFKLVKKADVAWHAEPDYYDSSPIARRPYCAACGTSLGFESSRQRENGPDRRHIRRSVALRARTCHFGAESMHRAWLNTEGLPQYRADRLPAAGRPLGRRDRQASPHDGRPSIAGPPRTGSSSPGTRSARGGR